MHLCHHQLNRCEGSYVHGFPLIPHTGDQLLRFSDIIKVSQEDLTSRRSVRIMSTVPLLAMECLSS